MKNLGINIFILICIVVYIYVFSVTLVSPNVSWDPLNESLLINYSNGFIRRGLLGEIIKVLHLKFGIDPFVFIKYFSLICYVGVCGHLLYLFIRKNISIFFLLLPYVLPYYLLIGWIRMRDFFLMLLFTISIAAIKKIGNKSLLFLILNILSTVGILAHETYFFISIPMFSVLINFEKYFQNNSNLFSAFLKVVLFAFLFFLPASFILLMSIYYHGDKYYAQVIFRDIVSFTPAYVQDIKMTVGIRSLGDNATNLIPFVYRELVWNGFSRGVSYTLFFIIILFIFSFFEKLDIPIFQKKAKSLNSNYLVIVFLFQFLCFLLIFIVAVDWQRWFSMIIYTTLIVNVYYSSRIAKQDLPRFLKTIPNSIKKIYNLFIPINKNTVIFVSIFCIIPYFPMGNTPYQFSNTFLILHNFLTKATLALFNFNL